MESGWNQVGIRLESEINFEINKNNKVGIKLESSWNHWLIPTSAKVGIRVGIIVCFRENHCISSVSRVGIKLESSWNQGWNQVGIKLESSWNHWLIPTCFFLLFLFFVCLFFVFFVFGPLFWGLVCVCMLYVSKNNKKTQNSLIQLASIYVNLYLEDHSLIKLITIYN